MNFEELAEAYNDKTGHLTNVAESSVWIRGEQCNVFSFSLDGKTYTCQEDPDDGYRSYCSDFEVEDDKLKFGFDCEVKIYTHRDNVLRFDDVVTGKTVLEVGTDYGDDYYPYCVQRFDPRGMAVNNP